MPEAPTEPEQPRDTGPDITTQISLSAIVIDEDERIALVERRQDKKLQQLRQGEKFNGWTLNQIQADDITMQKGHQTRQIALTVKLSRQTVQQPKDEKSEDVEKSIQYGIASQFIGGYEQRRVDVLISNGTVEGHVIGYCTPVSLTCASIRRRPS